MLIPLLNDLPVHLSFYFNKIEEQNANPKHNCPIASATYCPTNTLFLRLIPLVGNSHPNKEKIPSFLKMLNM
jgi:hypothetical protein